MAAEVTFVKYCPLCGAENPRQQGFCTACLDGDLSTVAPTPRREEQAGDPVAPLPSAETSETAGPLPTLRVGDTAADTCVLQLVEDPAVQFTVRPGQTVGRADRADVVLADVPKARWISAVHARFLLRRGQWYVQHVGTTNFIEVDGDRYQGSDEVAVYHGSVLVLSLTPFRVVLEGVGGG